MLASLISLKNISLNGFPPRAPTWRICKPVNKVCKFLIHLLIFLLCLSKFVAFVVLVAIAVAAAVVRNTEIRERIPGAAASQ